MFILFESILRKSPYLNSDVIDILEKGEEVESLKNLETHDGEVFEKVKFGEKIGYVVKTSIGENAVEEPKNNIKKVDKKNKVKIIKEAFKILNQDTSYSSKLNNKFYPNGKTRANGYYNMPYIENQKEIYSYDCSAFCSAIINRVFSKDMSREGSFVQITDEEKRPNLWVTKDFIANAKLESRDENKIFDIVEIAKNENDIVDSTNMEIGDFLIGIIDYDNEKHNKKYIMNHIMVYVGDSYIAHASFTNGTEIFDRVLFTKITDDFYTKLSYEKRFDKEIAIIRYIDK